MWHPPLPETALSVQADGQWTAEAKLLVPSFDEAALQMEVLEMATSDLHKAQHKDVGVSDFWINMVPQARFKNTRAVAMLLLTMFPSASVLILTANSDLVLVLVFWITHHLVLIIF